MFAYGKYRTWRFEYEDIEACLRKRPWLVDPKRMEQSYFRAIVRDAWQQDPWYNCYETAPLLGLVDHNAVHRYLQRGWLKYEKRPGAGGLGEYVIRRSAIDEMLAHDPRPEHERYAFLKSMKVRRKNWLSEGRPVAIMKEWLIRCPVCRHKVRIKAEPNLRAPMIKEPFTERYATGACTHGKRVLLEGRRKRADKSRAEN
ncbi:MAG: hypothetical protein V2A77_00020 [Pseudomonadota bacterium]